MMPIKAMRGSGTGGGGGATINVNPDTYSQAVIDPDDAEAEVTFGIDGNVTIFGDTGTPYAWRVGGASSDYDIRATPTSGAFSSGTASTWLNLATARSWRVVRTSLGTKSCTATFEIRNAASPFTVLDSATVIMTATVD